MPFKPSPGKPVDKDIPGWAGKEQTVPHYKGHPVLGGTRGHILHGPTSRNPDRHLHGPGLKYNMAAISNTTNQRMRGKPEEEAMKHIERDGILKYEVDVAYHSSPTDPSLKYVAKSVTVKLTAKDADPAKAALLKGGSYSYTNDS